MEFILANYPAQFSSRYSGRSGCIGIGLFGYREADSYAERWCHLS